MAAHMCGFPGVTALISLLAVPIASNARAPTETRATTGIASPTRRLDAGRGGDQRRIVGAQDDEPAGR